MKERFTGKMRLTSLFELLEYSKSSSLSILTELGYTGICEIFVQFFDEAIILYLHWEFACFLQFLKKLFSVGRTMP